MTTPDQISDSTTLADLDELLDAFGLMMTCARRADVVEVTLSDSDGVIGFAARDRLATALRAAITDFCRSRVGFDTGRMLS